MYLGKWRNQISDKINPHYYNSLFGEKGHYAFTLKKSNYIQNKIHIQVPIFSNSNFIHNSSLSFSFISEDTKLTPLGFNILVPQQTTRFSTKRRKFDSISQNSLLSQQLYTPGYIFSRGGSSLGISAVFVQQRFLDDNFNFLNLKSTSNFQLYNDKAFIDSNRGTGFQVNLQQQLFKRIGILFKYQSEINMNEFDSYGRSYSESGEFDIPSQLNIAVVFPFFKSKQFKFSAEKINYSQVTTVVNSGYSDDFIRLFDSPISSVFKLQDLVIYSAEFNNKINEHFSWNIGITSRQQASATKAVYTNLLKSETAAFSYKVGLTQKMSIGEFNVYASFANKPIIMGATDFGRLSNTSLNNHIEGVMSWSVSF